MTEPRIVSVDVIGFKSASLHHDGSNIKIVTVTNDISDNDSSWQNI